MIICKKNNLLTIFMKKYKFDKGGRKILFQMPVIIIQIIITGPEDETHIKKYLNVIRFK